VEIVTVTKEKDALKVELKSKEGRETIVVEKIITLERAAVLKDLGLSNIALDESRDHLIVNDKMETETEGVFAIGDLIGPPSQHYSHLASEGGIIAAENAMGGNSALNPKTRTRILFTQPQIASVGLTSREAKNEGYDVIVGAAPLSMNPFGMIIGENEGLVEIVAEGSYGEILGVHIIGTAASEMIGQAVVAMRMKATVEELATISFPHPTLSESVAEAARDALEIPIFLP
jgi:dihydrolipoamide dehydrogenase